MTTLNISNFGGEIPRLTARGLPLGAAQVSQNLLATSTDFEPLKSSRDVDGYVVSNEAKTLYRYQRGAGGADLVGESLGWIATHEDINFVRGQIVDDLTERTYLAYNGGDGPPRVMNNEGGNYKLGIPPPPKPEVALLPSLKLTSAQAIDFRDNTLAPTVAKYIREALSNDPFASRFTPTGSNNYGDGFITGASHAGITKFLKQDVDSRFMFFPMDIGTEHVSQRGFYEPWNMVFRFHDYQYNAEGLGNPLLKAVKVGNTVWTGFMGALPVWGVFNAESLRPKLAAISFLVDGVNIPLFDAPQVETILLTVNGWLSPDSYEAIGIKRKALDTLVFDYVVALFKLIYNPVTPVKLGTETDAVFAARLAAWQNEQRSAVATAVAAHEKAIVIGREIEAFYANIYDTLDKRVTTELASYPLAKSDTSVDGLFAVSPDPIIDSRFYLTTYVTAWGEESSPSEPSNMLEVDFNDLVVVNEPPLTDVSVSDQRNITKWRLYRSNSGSTSTAFQFVAEQAIGAQPVAPQYDVTTVGADLPGFGEKNGWRDVVATWRMYRKRGLVPLGAAIDVTLDTSKLVPGDRVTQNSNEVPPQYSVTKTWNGSAWVSQQVAIVTGSLNTACYLDGRASADLGEVCATVTWLPPPYRVNQDSTARIKDAKGANPYLRGLVAMANGVMAGYLDNFVAFCEPYVPYAWPVEYQLPLESPVTGLCAFGQSLLVGTWGAPYIISGADSASMSARRLNEPQACVSARSMVSAGSGVFYASQDGYCFANESSVTVVTAGLFTNEGWTALNPESIFAVLHDSVLYFWYSGNGGGCYGLDLTAKKLTRHAIPASAAFYDPVTDAAYITHGTKIKRLFAGIRSQGVWKSGKLTLPKQQPLAWIRVLADFNATPVTINWWADGVIRRTATFNSIEPQRLPPGRWLEHEVEVISSNRVTSVTMASTTEELQAS